jgi:tetratricopeptide (TPR) repeat protein
MSGRDREAIPNLESVLKVQSGLQPALIALGAARLATNQPQLAIAPLQRAAAADPQNQDALGMLASALTELKRFEQAAEVYRKLTELAPDDSRAWYGLGTTYEAIATSAFERLEKADPQSPYVTVLVADTKAQRRQFRSADFFYSEALKQLPGIHGIHAALADLYRKTGNPDLAADEDAKEQALPPADCTAHPLECQFVGGHDVQALTLNKSSKLQAALPSPEALFWQTKAANELALQAFFRLGQLPPSVELHQLRADMARDQKQPLEAVKEWRAALALSPGNPRVIQELAVSLFLAQEYRAAIDEARPLLKSNPKSPELNFVTGDSFLRLEEPETAVPYLRAALAANPKLLAADASLGLALSRLGQQKEAIPYLEKALGLDDDGSLHYQLARAYQAEGAAEKARSAMAQYQEILKRVQQQKDPT